jgi:hypothetical protein
MWMSFKLLCLLAASVCVAMTVIDHLGHGISSPALLRPDGSSVAQPQPSFATIMNATVQQSVNETVTLAADLESSARAFAKVSPTPESAAATDKTSLLASASSAKDAALVDDDPRPRNLHLAMIGDSVSRFQYIALAHFLHYGRHVRNRDRPQKLILRPNGMNDTFYDLHKVLLHPNEQCDCIRTVKWNPSISVDNRYYYDPVRNNSLTFLLKYGSLEAHGRWAPADVHESHNQSFEQGTFVWNGNWSAAFRHLDAIRPRPNYVVFNAGHHPNRMYDSAIQDDITRTLQELHMLGIYKYTTCSKGNRRSQQHTTHEDAMCARMEHRCIEYNWTCSLDPSNYYDKFHLRPDMNQRMNEELLAYLREV